MKNGRQGCKGCNFSRPSGLTTTNLAPRCCPDIFTLQSTVKSEIFKTTLSSEVQLIVTRISKAEHEQADAAQSAGLMGNNRISSPQVGLDDRSEIGVIMWKWRVLYVEELEPRY